MAEQYTEEEEDLAQNLILADEELTLGEAKRRARQQLAEQKQDKPKGEAPNMTTQTEQTIGWNEIEDYLQSLSPPDLQKFNSRYTELYKQLTDPRYKAVIDVKEKISELEKEMEAADDLATYKNLQTKYKNLTRHLEEAVRKAATPNRTVVEKSYKVGDEVILWNGRGTIPDKIKDYLKSKKWDENDKSIKMTNLKKELLAKIEVK